VLSRLEHRRRHVTHERRRSVPRRSDRGLPARGGPPLERVAPQPSRTEPRDAGTPLLLFFSAAVFPMVGLVWLVGTVDRTWLLVPVMVVHLSLTAAVLVLTSRLLDDAGDE
jgi:hypothetical protein